MSFKVLRKNSKLIYHLTLSIFLFFDTVYCLPLTDTYSVTSRNLIDDIQNSTFIFDNSPSNAVSSSGLTRIKELSFPFDGIPGGVEIQKADGTFTNISSWSESGYIIEFTLSSTDGKFISFSPYKTDWGLRIEDIDIEPQPGATPEVLGMYIDFSNLQQDLSYNLNPDLLTLTPLGVGKHPIENKNVLYASSVGSAFSDYAFAVINNNKLKINLDSNLQFESFSLDSIVKALGLTNDAFSPPLVNVLRIGVLVKGINVPQYILLTGDFNCDLSVDAADYVIWRHNYGKTNVGPCSGDANGDRNVDGADFLLWMSNYGSVYQPPALLTVIGSPAEGTEFNVTNPSPGNTINQPNASRLNFSSVGPVSNSNSEFSDNMIKSGTESKNGNKKKKPSSKKKKQKTKKKIKQKKKLTLKRQPSSGNLQ